MMRFSQINSTPGSYAVLIAVFNAANVANAQVGKESDGITYSTDAYGNVQPIVSEWRSVGSFGNPVEQESLEGYQTSTRRFGQRSGLEPFALPSDVWAVSRLAATGTTAAPSVKSSLSERKRRAFERYGGFASRRKTKEETDPSDAMTRKTGLFGAYALNAPVYRAMTRPNAMVDLKSSVGRTPFLYAEVEEGEREAPALSAQLERTDAGESRRMRDEAWTLFRDGEYRRAIGAFEAALTLQPDDAETRIGEVFAYLTVGARRTSAALFAELLRRDENPFGHDLRMRDRYANPIDPNTLQIQAGMAARDEGQSVDANALYTFVLWYLGEQEEAMRAAGVIARRGGNRPYAYWPEKMRAARSASTASSPSP